MNFKSNIATLNKLKSLINIYLSQGQTLGEMQAIIAFLPKIIPLGLKEEVYNNLVNSTAPYSQIVNLKTTVMYLLNVYRDYDRIMKEI